MAFVEDRTLLHEDSGTEQVRPHGSKLLRVCASVAACVALVGSGYLAGRGTAQSTQSLGNLIGEVGVPQTVEQAKTLYTQITRDMTFAEKAAVNMAVTQANAPTDANQALLHTWYSSGAAASDKTVMQNFLYDALVAVDTGSKATAAPDAVPAHGSYGSYEAFGKTYSHETAGKTWPEITKIDAMVREVKLPIGCSATVRKLNLWYHNHLTATQRKHFDDEVVAHMKQGEALR